MLGYFLVGLFVALFLLGGFVNLVEAWRNPYGRSDDDVFDDDGFGIGSQEDESVE